MPALLALSALSCLVMTGGAVALLRPRASPAFVLRALGAAAVAAFLTTTIGGVLDADTPEFLLSVSFAVAPVGVVLCAAAHDLVPQDARFARMLLYGWASIVFPLCVIASSSLVRWCGSLECRVEDFGAALPLLISSAASLLLAGPARSFRSASEPGGGRFLSAVGVIWVGALLWLVSLEGVLDAYTPRILLNAVLAPLAGAIAWLIVARLQRSGRSAVSSLASGVCAGLVVIVPGVATVSAPWSLAVGAFAGAAAALAHGAQRFSASGPVWRWTCAVLVAAVIGYLAPAITGDGVGFLFSGRITALLPPLGMFLCAVAAGALVSLPAWGRRVGALSGK